MSFAPPGVQKCNFFFCFKLVRNLVSHIKVGGGTWTESVRKQAAGEIFGPERDEVTGEWTKLPNEGLYDLYSWSHVMWLRKSRKTRWARHMTCMGSAEMLQCSCTKTLRKKTGNRPLGRPRYRWEENIKMDPTETGWNSVDCVNLALDRDKSRAVTNAVTKLKVLQNTGNFLTIWGTASFSRKTLFPSVRYNYSTVQFARDVVDLRLSLH